MAGFAQRALGRSLSSSVNVLASTTTRGLTLAATIAATVSCSALGCGRLVMMTGALAATSRIPLAISTPARASARQAFGSMSWPIDLPAGCGQIARESAAHDAEPTTPTVPFASLPFPFPDELRGRYTDFRVMRQTRGMHAAPARLWND